MQKFLRIMLLAALAAMPLATQAQNDTLTICDGTATNQYVPFYAYYADATQNGQMIYPADSLNAMLGRPIYGLKFYISSTGYGNGVDAIGNWIVSIGTVDGTTLSGINSNAALTEVYSGAMSFNSSTTEMTVTFTDPYIYAGGNLMLQFNHPVSADYQDISFSGVSAEGASYCYGGQRNFLPKVSFVCGAVAGCMPVMAVTASNVTSDGATLTWIDTTNSGATYRVSYWMNGGDTTTVTTTTTSYTISGLDANSLCRYTVTAVCSASEESVPASGSFATACGGSTCDLTVGAWGG